MCLLCKRIIPQEIARSNHAAFEHRVVFTVPWKNSWQLWLQRDNKNCLFMIKEDWDEFVDDNLLGSDDTLVFTHQGTMYFQVRIFKKDGKEVVSAPLKVPEPETEPVILHPKPESSHQELTTPASGKDHFKETIIYLSLCQKIDCFLFFCLLYWRMNNFQQVEGRRVLLSDAS